ncbi:MAG: hypothetical protein ACRD3W_14920, partial [Terriglobales bacterium]
AANASGSANTSQTQPSSFLSNWAPGFGTTNPASSNGAFSNSTTSATTPLDTLLASNTNRSLSLAQMENDWKEKNKSEFYSELAIQYGSQSPSQAASALFTGSQLTSNPLVSTMPTTPANSLQVKVTPTTNRLLTRLFTQIGRAPDTAKFSTGYWSAATSIAAAQLAGNTPFVPHNAYTQALGAQAAWGVGYGDSMGGVAKDQAGSAIDYASKFLYNFTTDGANRWNRIRNSIFVPIAVLLLLPGAVLAQAKSIVAAGSPVLGDTNPFEGIMRSMVAIFLIPGTYLIVNWGIDFSNAIVYAINSEYARITGSDMYKDAMCAELRAFPTGGNQQGAQPQGQWPPQTPIPGNPFGGNEGYAFDNGSGDPCGASKPPDPNKTNENMPGDVWAMRMITY